MTNHPPTMKPRGAAPRMRVFAPRVAPQSFEELWTQPGSCLVGLGWSVNGGLLRRDRESMRVPERVPGGSEINAVIFTIPALASRVLGWLLVPVTRRLPTQGS